MKLRLPVLACAAVLAAAGTAVAKPPASAVRMTDAVLRADRAAASHRAEVLERARRVRDVCGPVLRDEEDARLSRTDSRRATVLLLSAYFDASARPALPELGRLVADLESIPTRDPALRSGRAAWRANYDEFLRFPYIDDACGVLARWKASGWSAEQAPRFDLAPYEALLEESDGEEPDGRFAKLERAERRLLVLGVSRRRARAFRGDGAFEELGDLVDDTVFGDDRGRER